MGIFVNQEKIHRHSIFSPFWWVQGEKCLGPTIYFPSSPPNQTHSKNFSFLFSFQSFPSTLFHLHTNTPLDYFFFFLRDNYNMLLTPQLEPFLPQTPALCAWGGANSGTMPFTTHPQTREQMWQKFLYQIHFEHVLNIRFICTFFSLL